MFGGFLLVLATVWAVVVTDGVVESARGGGGDLVEFGRRLASPGVPEGIWILAGLAASAAFALAMAFGSVRERRLSRRTTVNRDEQRTQRAHRDAGDEGRGRLLAWRLAELQTQIAELTARREELRLDVREEEVREDRLTSVGLQRRPDQPVVVVPEVAREPVAPKTDS
jgi:hypothetical protein